MVAPKKDMFLKHSFVIFSFTPLLIFSALQNEMTERASSSLLSKSMTGCVLL